MIRIWCRPPAADPLYLARNINEVTGGSVFGSFVVSAYTDTYSDVTMSEVVKPAAIPFVKKLASRCLSEPGVLASVLTALSLGDQQILSRDPTGHSVRDCAPTSLATRVPGRS